MTKVTMEMPEEAARKLLKMFEENPEKFKRHFASAGIEIESLAATFPTTAQTYRCRICGTNWTRPQLARDLLINGDACCVAHVGLGE